jgi:small redox-active disulfide protein 2
MKIEVFGTGCAKCEALATQAKLAADQLGVEYELVKVNDLKDMASRGVLITPALAVDGVVKLSGKAASANEIAELLKQC